MKRYPNEATRRFDQQFAETTAERNGRLREARLAARLPGEGAVTTEDGRTLANLRERFAYQEAERFVTGYEEDIRFLLRLVDKMGGENEALKSSNRVLMQMLAERDAAPAAP